MEEALDGGSVDCGYSCTEEWVTITDESVTTEAPTDVVNPTPQAPISSSKQIVADTIKVTFDGTVYECEKKTNRFVDYYGADLPTLPGGDIDWSQYPFAIISSQGNSILNTETAGTYQVKIEAYEKTVETSECFKKAVESVRTGAFQVRAVSKDADTGIVTYNCSSSQLRNAYIRGDYITFYDELSDSTPLMLRDCVVGQVGSTPTLVGMINYVTHQTTASNSQVTSLQIEFNIPSSGGAMLTSGGK